MKKLLSLLLAAVTVTTVAVTAFAQGKDTTNTPTPGITFEKDVENDKNLGDMLTPGETYKFPIKLTDENGVTSDVTEDEMKTHKFSFTSKEGSSAISSMKAVKENGVYVLEIAVKAGWPVKETDVEYTAKYMKKTSSSTIYSTSVEFTVGYEKIPQSALDAAANGDSITVLPTAPVITKDQFTALDKTVNGDKVIFANDDWSFQVRISGQDSLNMLNNNYAIKEISQKFENQSFKYVSFPGGPNFDFTGELVIDVSDEEDDFDGKFFVYRYLNGKLSKIDATYSKEDSTVSFNTKSLGRFVITNKAITDGTIIDNSTSSGSGSSNGDASEGNGNTSKPNPPMGAGNVVPVAVAVAVIGLTAAGAVAFKKASK